MNNTMTLRGSDSLARDTRLVLRTARKTAGRPARSPPARWFAPCSATANTGVTLQVHDEAMFGQVLARGDIGLAEAYLDGHWDSPDVTGLLTLLARNRDVLKQGVYGSWRNCWRPASGIGSTATAAPAASATSWRTTISGNDFYKLWLDPSMSYSSGALPRLWMAATSKPRSAPSTGASCAASTPNRASSVLEVGCGWGGFAEMAVQEGLRVTGLTLSPAQLEWAQRRVPEADLRLQDYRDTREQFDHVVSIEMFEAVGERWWPTYFKTVARALKPGGRAVDPEHHHPRRPVCRLSQGHRLHPAIHLPRRHAAVALGLPRAGRPAGTGGARGIRLRPDYARTLADWRLAFEASWPQIAALGFDEPFRRLWRMYLCYCEAGFLAGNIDVVQFELGHH
jgi:cyclopropane-fatty-acyl-phospholipid synthase